MLFTATWIKFSEIWSVIMLTRTSPAINASRRAFFDPTRGYPSADMTDHGF
jgi:hypothetical protein